MATILVVEDKQPARQSIVEVLDGAGHQVLEAEDGEQALERLAAATVDLVIADIWMPRLNGIALLKAIKTRDTAPPVLVITGGSPVTSLEVSAILADTWAADQILYKPFEPRDLLAAVSRLLQG